MAFINISPDFTSLLSVLNRIAEALERLSPPIALDILGMEAVKGQGGYKRGLESLTTYGDNTKTWQKQEFQEMISEVGLSKQQEESALAEVMQAYQEDEEDVYP